MKVGIDTFTLRDLGLNPLQMLEYVREHRLQGALFGGLPYLTERREAAEIKEVRAEADRHNLFTHVSVPTCNPHLVPGDLDEHRKSIVRAVEEAATCGWHELHASLGGGDERYTHPVRWTQHLSDAAEFIRSLGPVLRAHKSRINLETHGDTTTFELIRIIEDVGPDICGICLDTANVLCHAEDPTWAARRAAPYTHLTHIKDAVGFFIDTGFRRQTHPPGRGSLDWAQILPALSEYQPDLPLCIEDHKWFFDFHIFDRHWLSLHPDLTREELMRVTRFIYCCENRLRSGELPDPAPYEEIPHVDELEERLGFARDYLNETVQRLGLAT